MQNSSEALSPIPHFKITTRVEMITPEMAKAYISNVHPDQRRLRPNSVRAYAEIMKRGDWILVPDGIAFDTDGFLIQGNHRLNALIAANVTLPFNVTRNAPKMAYSVLDRGLIRSASDALGVERKKLEIATTLIRIALNPHVAKDIQQIKKYYSRLEAPINIVFSSITAMNGRGASAPVRTAVVARFICGENLEWMSGAYATIAKQRFEHMTPIQAAYWRKEIAGQFGGGNGQLHRFVAGLKIFDKSRQSATKLYINENDINAARALAAKIIGS